MVLWSFGLVPGALQTEEVARLILAGRPEAAVSNRMARHDIFVRRLKPVRLLAIIGETALRVPVGGHAMMARQMRSLLDDVRYDTIEIRILPTNAGYHGGLVGSYTLLEFGDGSPETTLGHVELLQTSLIFRDPAEIAEYQQLTRSLCELSLSADDSAAFIEMIEREHHAAAHR